MGFKPKRHKIAEYLQSFSLCSSEFVRNLGVTIDADLSFYSHINRVTKSSFFRFGNIWKMQSFLSDSDSEKLVHVRLLQ